jgi:hypothetical protein
MSDRQSQSFGVAWVAVAVSAVAWIALGYTTERLGSVAARSTAVAFARAVPESSVGAVSAPLHGVIVGSVVALISVGMTVLIASRARDPHARAKRLIIMSVASIAAAIVVGVLDARSTVHSVEALGVHRPNKALERTVMDKVPTGHASRAASSTLTRHRAAAQRQR